LSFWVGIQHQRCQESAAALLVRVGETQILKLKKPEDDEQDTGLDIIIEFDGSTTFPAWVINNGDMSFKIIPNSQCRCWKP